ncbi:MAG TPA: nuclease-related domain-containing protein [Gammaproteobacteria bacterium]
MQGYWFVAIGAIAALVLALILALLVWRRRQSDLGSTVRSVAIDSAHRVLVPNGMGGYIELEHLLLTAHGLVVVDTKAFEGTIFGSDRMEEWTVMSRQRRFTFPNPQHTLYDRIAAVRRLVRDIPVEGHVVFSPAADFSKGRPREVMLADEFVERYKKPDRGEVERLKAAFAPQWERVREALQPVSDAR